ncbi:hypothetical protein MAM1_0331c09757 [Mucor ambiguus]|uniref:Uncharacterized protein n=1 Tax=Mucor ambiguus TaxID=91626 RepID=A0A0C9MRZ3_9FUNG|nr:hypothetical protein MAM1_0331c09757 [Mucor ambiguus]
MASKRELDSQSPIDNDLFHAYTRYQLCQLKNSTSLWTCNQEKEAMLNILGQFETIDGNTLRMVVNQIFENSVQMYNCNETNESFLGYQGESSSTSHLENALSSPSNASVEVSDNSGTIQDRTWNVCTRSTSKKPELIQEHPIAKKSKPLDATIRKLRKHISRTNLEELCNLTDHVERSKYVVLTRMRRVNTSFTFRVSAATADHSLHISNPLGDYRNPMSVCQANLIAYRFGKVFDLAECHLESEKKKMAKLACYHIIKEELKAHGKQVATPIYKYARYAQSVVRAAEEIGVYVLFIPEVLGPYTLQTIKYSNFSELASCLNAQCAEFKEIARFDHDENLIMTEMNYSREHGDNSYRRTKSKFLNSCA